MSLETSQFDAYESKQTPKISSEEQELGILELQKQQEIQHIVEETQKGLQGLKSFITKNQQNQIENKENTETPRLPVFDEIDARLQRGYDYKSQLIDDIYSRLVNFQESKENRKAIRNKTGVDFTLPGTKERNTLTPDQKMGKLMDTLIKNKQVFILENVRLEDGTLGIGGRLIESHGSVSYTFSAENQKVLYDLYNLDLQSKRDLQINLVDARSAGQTNAYKFNGRFLPYGEGHILVNSKIGDIVDGEERGKTVQNEIAHKLFYEQFTKPKNLDMSQKLEGVGINEVVDGERFSFPNPTLAQVDEFISDVSSIATMPEDRGRIVVNLHAMDIANIKQDGYRYSNYFTRYLIKTIGTQVPEFKQKYDALVLGDQYSRKGFLVLPADQRNERLAEFRKEMKDLINRTLNENNGAIADLVKSTYLNHGKQLLDAVRKLK